METSPRGTPGKSVFNVADRDIISDGIRLNDVRSSSSVYIDGHERLKITCKNHLNGTSVAEILMSLQVLNKYALLSTGKKDRKKCRIL